MKFEIDVNGYIFPELPIVQLGAQQPCLEYADSKQLELILQAVKKTQEKLVNIQIQEIQDSKNSTSDEYQRRYEESLEDKHNEKIEQNQKIVDEITKMYQTCLQEGTLPIVGMNAVLHPITTLERIVKAGTGKDIKDL